MSTLDFASAADTRSVLHALFNPRYLAQDLDWQPFSADGRSKVSIARLYDARKHGRGPAAAILRYEPGAQVPAHLHQGYELILVLEGELVNDAGRHGPGTLEICPPGSVHALSSDTGCTFLVVWEEPVIKLPA